MDEMDQVWTRIETICVTLSYVAGIAIAAAVGVIGIIIWWLVFG